MMLMRPVRVSQRSYCGDFIFEGDSLTTVNFGGGYYDGEGQPHFRHADWQGNIAMVTDRDGRIEQHNGYYPYGEPWREPTGQPYLFGDKERMHDGGLNDYDFVARRLNSDVGIWSTPDPMAADFAGTNPYVYCGANPIKFIDPSGCTLQIVGTDVQGAMDQLKQAVKGINLFISDDGNVSYKQTGELNYYASKLIEIIDNSDITTSVTTYTNPVTDDGDLFYGGAYLGNEYSESDGTVFAKQAVMPKFLQKMGNLSGEYGVDMIHELTEAYEGGKIALENKKSSPNADVEGTTYSTAHNRAVSQSVLIEAEYYDKNGNSIPESRYKKAAIIKVKASPNSLYPLEKWTIIHTIYNTGAQK